MKRHRRRHVARRRMAWVWFAEVRGLVDKDDDDVALCGATAEVPS